MFIPVIGNFQVRFRQAQPSGQFQQKRLDGRRVVAAEFVVGRPAEHIPVHRQGVPLDLLPGIPGGQLGNVHD